MMTRLNKTSTHLCLLFLVLSLSAQQCRGEILPLWKITLESLTEMQTRPLFTENRQGLLQEPPPPPQPPPPETPVVVAPPETLQATLLGVLRSADDFGLVVIKEASGEKVKQIKVGETYEGWKLSSVSSGEAIFERNGQKVRLQLQKYKFKGANIPAPTDIPASNPPEVQTPDNTSMPSSEPSQPEPQQSEPP